MSTNSLSPCCLFTHMNFSERSAIRTCIINIFRIFPTLLIPKLSFFIFDGAFTPLFCLIPFYSSLSLSLSALCRLRHSFSLISRSIARRGRGDAATPCPSIPLRLATRGSQPWSKYFVISLPDSRSNGRTTLQLARHRRYSLILLIISPARTPNITRRWAPIVTLSKPLMFHPWPGITQKLYRFRFFSPKLGFAISSRSQVSSLDSFLKSDITPARIDDTNINIPPPSPIWFLFFITTECAGVEPVRPDSDSFQDELSILLTSCLRWISSPFLPRQIAKAARDTSVYFKCILRGEACRMHMTFDNRYLSPVILSRYVCDGKQCDCKRDIIMRLSI